MARLFNLKRLVLCKFELKLLEIAGGPASWLLAPGLLPKPKSHDGSRFIILHHMQARHQSWQMMQSAMVVMAAPVVAHNEGR